MKKNKLAIFDMDGTLFDTRATNYHAYNEALKLFGYEIDFKSFCDECNGKHYTAFLPKFSTGDLSVLEKIHLQKKDYYSNYVKYSTPNSMLFSVIESIQNDFYIALVTTASKKNVEDILSYFNKQSIFDLVITQEDVSKQKPDPEGFLKAMQKFGIEKNKTIIFEDSDTGIIAAKESGAEYIRVYGYN